MCQPEGMFERYPKSAESIVRNAKSTQYGLGNGGVNNITGSDLLA
jgi:hypothetical protein